jgi:hypothetical protein
MLKSDHLTLQYDCVMTSTNNLMFLQHQFHWKIPDHAITGHILIWLLVIVYDMMSFHHGTQKEP